MKRILNEHRIYPPKIVASVASWEEWKALKGQDLTQQCDWVELRADAMPEGMSAEEVMTFRPNMPLLITVRSHEEGGMRVMNESDRFDLLRSYFPYATAVDLEIRSMRHGRELINEAHDRGIYVIGSIHDFQITPGVDYLKEQAKIARSYKADIVKFAFTPCLAQDLQTGVQLFQEADGPIAVMGMGPLAAVSRLLYSQLGSCLVYGYPGDKETAPGQWPISLIKTVLSTLTPIFR